MMLQRLGLLSVAMLIAGVSCAADAPMAPPAPPAAPASSLVTAAPAGAEVYFITPQDGDVVDATFSVRFGLKGMGVAPAGIDAPNTGHHHILIDHAGDYSLDTPLPANDQVKHFGGGQTETTLTLSPGKHTLQLVLGNHLHIPHNPPVVSKVITVTVKGE